MSERIWSMMMALARLDFVVRVNLRRLIITIAGVPFEPDELERILQEELWRPLV